MLVTAREGSSAIAEVMTVMSAAFDPAFGEAWTSAQCTGALGLGGTWLNTVRLDGALIGFAVTRAVLEDAELMLIAVHPDHHGTGAGSCLMAAVMDECRKCTVQNLHVEVREDNPALAFYTKHKFTRIGLRPNYYRRTDGNSAHAITLCRVFTSI